MRLRSLESASELHAESGLGLNDQPMLEEGQIAGEPGPITLSPGPFEVVDGHRGAGLGPGEESGPGQPNLPAWGRVGLRGGDEGDLL